MSIADRIRYVETFLLCWGTAVYVLSYVIGWLDARFTRFVYKAMETSQRFLGELTENQEQNEKSRWARKAAEYRNRMDK